MPRQSRIDAPGALHHIICRGITRQRIFRDDTDRDNFVGRLGTVLSETGTRCYAWALIPNHFHLLLQTGTVPVSTIMRRLLTGYSVSFNRRHKRSGHLFQNRYKSILCEEEPYLLELVRYIHLNPVRAGVVPDLGALSGCSYCGHRTLLGKTAHGWQEVGTVLERFGDRLQTARKSYLAFIADGLEQGKRPDLTGGGLVRSVGGWQQVKALRNSGMLCKSDERILGGSDFVEAVLDHADDIMVTRDEYRRRGVDLESAIERAGRVCNVGPEEMGAGGKHPQTVKARSLACYWAVRKLGYSATAVAKRLNLSQPAASRAVLRGERLAAEFEIDIEEGNA